MFSGVVLSFGRTRIRLRVFAACRGMLYRWQALQARKWRERIVHEATVPREVHYNKFQTGLIAGICFISRQIHRFESTKGIYLYDHF